MKSLPGLCFEIIHELNELFLLSDFFADITWNPADCELCVCTVPRRDRPGGRADHSEGRYRPDPGSQTPDETSNRSHIQHWNSETH